MLSLFFRCCRICIVCFFNYLHQTSSRGLITGPALPLPQTYTLPEVHIKPANVTEKSFNAQSWLSDQQLSIGNQSSERKPVSDVVLPDVKLKVGSVRLNPCLGYLFERCWLTENQTYQRKSKNTLPLVRMLSEQLYVDVFFNHLFMI